MSPLRGNIAGNVGGDDRHNALAGEFFHEQIQEARIHRVQRRSSDQHFSLERRAARLTRGEVPVTASAKQIVAFVEERLLA
jgi:hypothetical protein